MLTTKAANHQVTKLIHCEKILDSMLPQETNLKLLTIACLASTYFCMKDVCRANRYLDHHELFIYNQLSQPNLSIQLHLLSLKAECLV